MTSAFRLRDARMMSILPVGDDVGEPAEERSANL